MEVALVLIFVLHHCTTIGDDDKKEKTKQVTHNTTTIQSYDTQQQSVTANSPTHTKK